MWETDESRTAWDLAPHTRGDFLPQKEDRQHRGVGVTFSSGWGRIEGGRIVMRRRGGEL